MPSRPDGTLATRAGLVGRTLRLSCDEPAIGRERPRCGRATRSQQPVSRPLPLCERSMNWEPARTARPPARANMAAMERQQDYVLRTVEERGVRLIRLWFTDVLGQLKSVAISPAELENAFDEGMHFDGSAIDGFSRVQESDVLAKPDPNSFELLPWAKGDDPSARMFCDIFNHDGEAFEGDPRQVLKRNLDKAREQGFSFYVAPEMEFFYFGDGDPSHAPEPLDTGLVLRPHHRRRGQRPAQAHHPHARGHGHPGRVLVPRGRAQPARDRPALHRRAVDGRQRDDLPPRRARDRARAGRVRHVHAQAHLDGVQGSGMHTHMSLFEGDTNAFHEPGDPYGLSKVARGLHRRAAGARPRDHRGHQPAGQLVQAPDRRLRGAGAT